MGTHAVYCEANQTIPPYTFDIARFHTFYFSKFVVFSNLCIVKNQLLRAFTFRQQTKNEDLVVIYRYDYRALANLQYRTVCLDDNNIIQT